MNVSDCFEKNHYEMAIISNINICPYLEEYVYKNIYKEKKGASIEIVDYGEYKQLPADKFDIIVVILNFEMLFPNLIDSYYKFSGKEWLDNITNICINLYDCLKKKSNAKIIWFGFEDYSFSISKYSGNVIFFDNLVGNVNNTIDLSIEEGDVFVDLKRIIAKYGYDNLYSIKNKYRWNAPYSKELIKLIANEICTHIYINENISKKCLVLDCDNVLWGGILVEDGIENVKLGNLGVGKIYKDFQRYLLYLYYHGIILTICSKNDEYMIKKMFNEHSEMVLKEKHIACMMANWNNKAENIKKISDDINIGTKDMIFIDDSENEINIVKNFIPDITTVLYNNRTIFDSIEKIYFRHKINQQIVEERQKAYRTNQQRREYIKNNKNAYGIDITIDIHDIKNMEITRVSELSQRTNKCTNGKRYNVQELMSTLTEGNYKMYTVSVKDQFSDLGLVGVIGIQEKCLDIFSLSCRALGLGVEERMLRFCEKLELNEVSFRETGKNSGLLKKLKKCIYMDR